MPDSPPSRSSSGLFSSVHRLLDALADLADEGTQQTAHVDGASGGNEFKRTIQFGSDTDDGLSGVIGVHVRTVTGGSATETNSGAPFGNVREDKSGEIVIDP